MYPTPAPPHTRPGHTPQSHSNTITNTTIAETGVDLESMLRISKALFQLCEKWFTPHYLKNYSGIPCDFSSDLDVGSGLAPRAFSLDPRRHQNKRYPNSS